jgi:hypothetical protein
MHGKAQDIANNSPHGIDGIVTPLLCHTLSTLSCLIKRHGRIASIAPSVSSSPGTDGFLDIHIFSRLVLEQHVGEFHDVAAPINPALVQRLNRSSPFATLPMAIQYWRSGAAGV